VDPSIRNNDGMTLNDLLSDVIRDLGEWRGARAGCEKALAAMQKAILDRLWLFRIFLLGIFLERPT
jgi:hypothetical protein